MGPHCHIHIKERGHCVEILLTEAVVPLCDSSLPTACRAGGGCICGQAVPDSLAQAALGSIDGAPHATARDKRDVCRPRPEFVADFIEQLVILDAGRIALIKARDRRLRNLRSPANPRSHAKSIPPWGVMSRLPRSARSAQRIGRSAAATPAKRGRRPLPRQVKRLTTVRISAVGLFVGFAGRSLGVFAALSIALLLGVCLWTPKGPVPFLAAAMFGLLRFVSHDSPVRLTDRPLTRRLRSGAAAS